MIHVGTLGRTTEGARTDFTNTNTAGTMTDDNISRAPGSVEEAKNVSQSDKSSENYVPLNA